MNSITIIKSNKESFFSYCWKQFRRLAKSQKWLYFLYALILIPNLRILFRAVELRTGLSFFTDYSDAFFIIIAALGSFAVLWKEIQFKDVIFVLFLIAFHQFSAYLFPVTAPFSEENAMRFILYNLPCYFVGLTINNRSSLALFIAISFLSLALQVLFRSVLGTGVNEQGDAVTDMMTEAYDFLPAVLFVLWYAFERKSLMEIFFAVMAVFLLMSMGTRGPVVCIVLFAAIYFLFFKRFKYNALIKTLIAMVAIIFSFFSLEIALLLSVIASSLGLSTRVFDRIVGENGQSQYFESAGRDEIVDNVTNYLTNNSSLWGDGLYADRIYSGNIYAHNLELELLCDFGWVGGTMLIIMLLLFILIAFNKSLKNDGYIFMLVFFFPSIMQLQFSGSFLNTPVFWMFIGICVAMIRSKRVALKQ